MKCAARTASALIRGAMVLLVAAIGRIEAQSPTTIVGTQVFFTNAWGPGGAPGGTPRFDNLRVSSGGGPQFTINFELSPSVGNGVYGPIHQFGAYQLEYFWWTPTGTNIGHTHVSNTGNPGQCEATHANGADYQGFRISRLDGAAFQLHGVDYAAATVGLAISTSFSNPATWPSYGSAEGLVLNDPTWRTFTFMAPTAFAFDPAIGDIVTPAEQAQGCATMSSTATVSVQIRNAGSQAIAAATTLQLSYAFNGGTPVIEMHALPSVLASTAVTVFTFATPADLSMITNHQLTVTVSSAADTNAANNSVTRMIQTVVSTFPWLETFDGLPFTVTGTTPPPLWAQDAVDSSPTAVDWRFTSQPTPTLGTGPEADHTTGITGSGSYATVDDDTNAASVNLLTPCFDLSSLTRPVLHFWIHSFNAGFASQTASLSIDIIDSHTGTITLNVIPTIRHIGDFWTYVLVDLTPHSDDLRVRFRINTQNTVNTHDIAIDDVGISEGGLPGSGEDLSLGIVVNGEGIPELTGKTALAGDLISIRTTSPQGSFATLPPIVAGALFPSSTIPAGPAFFPEIHLPLASSFVVFDGSVPGPFGPTVLGVNGLTLHAVVPPGLAGQTVRIQSLVLTPVAANGIFAITDALDVHLL